MKRSNKGRSRKHPVLEAFALALGVVLVLAVAVAGTWAYRYQKKIIVDRTFDTLRNQANLSGTFLNRWMMECKVDLGGLPSERAMVPLRSDPGRWEGLGPEEREAIRAALTAYSARRRFNAAALFDAAGRLIRGSEVGDMKPFPNKVIPGEPAAGIGPIGAKFHGGGGGIEHLQVRVPLAAQSPASLPMEAVFFLNPWGPFYSSLFCNFIDFKSVEPMLFQREGHWVVCTTPTRLSPSRPCALREPFDKREMASLAVAGQIKEGAGRDYRGVDVLYATQYVAWAAWGLVVKVDQKEAFAPLNVTLSLLILLIVLSASAVGHIAWIGWRRSHEAVLEKLQSLDLQYRSLVECAREGIWVWDAGGKTVLVNPRLGEMLGTSPKQLAAIPFPSLLGPGHGDLASSYFMPRPPLHGEEHEVCLMKSDGGELWGNLSLSGLHTPDGEFRGTLGMVTDITVRRRVEKEKSTLLQDLEQKKIELQQVLRQLFSTQERERRKLSHELHDEVVQLLMATDGCLQGALNQVAPQAAIGPAASNAAATVAGTMLREARGHLGDAGALCRRLVMELRPPEVERLGLVRTLEKQLEGVAGVKPHIAVIGGEVVSRLSTDDQIVLCRVVQEALQNIRKHAGAREVRIGIEGAPSEVTVEVEDDGQGFQAAEPSCPGHFGLLVMRERMEQAGGTCGIQSLPGEGTKVVFKLPVKAKEAGLRLVDGSQP